MELDTRSLCNNFNSLKLNIVSGYKINFLDLLISVDAQKNSFNFELYTKPTHSFQYLFHTSNHPEFIFKNIPKSLFIRLRRICSYYADYL